MKAPQFLTLLFWAGPVVVGVAVFLWSEWRRKRKAAIALIPGAFVMPAQGKTGFDRLATVIDIGAKVVGATALIVGGLWTWKTFVEQRQGQWNLQVTVDSRIIDLPNDGALLVVDVKLNNIGLVDIKPYAPSGLILNVFEHMDLEKEQQEVKTKDEPTAEEKTIVYPAIMPWRPEDSEHVRPLVDGFNLLSRYGKGYRLHPRVEYHETEAVKVTRGRLYSVSAGFHVDTGDHINPRRRIADSMYVFVPEAPKRANR